MVERPASVVKELLENALDAGAGSVTVELERGGRKLVAVRDDGCGMSRHELLLAVQRHATSKIATGDDLRSLETLGFRGEALPSIAAVSHFSILSSDGSDGWELRMDGGVLAGVQPAPRTRGTTVMASGLFFNQPARRKFLRTVATELAWVERYVTGCSLAWPEVEFKLLHDGNQLFHLPSGASIPSRLRARYALPESARSLEASGVSGGTEAHLVWFPDQRWNRNTHQFVLVNGRLVHSGMVSSILGSSLAGPAGYPLVCCRLRVPPAEVDVNVHPAKREVRFREPSRIRDALDTALRELTGTGRAAYSAEISRPGRGYAVSSPGGAADMDRGLFDAAMDVGKPRFSGGGSRRDDEFPIVQIGRSYLVTSTDKGIVLIDQHAAHERILFENVLKALRSDSDTGRQTMLLPEAVKLDPSEIEQLRSYDGILRRSGFEFHIDDDTLILTAVPQGTFHGIEALREILRSLQDPEFQEMPVQERVAAAAACAGAVKFGDPLSPSETRHLVDQLFSTSDPFRCPHGRPTVVEMTYEELAKRFGR